MDKVRYSVNGKSFIIRAAAFFMAVSMVFRVMGYWGFWKYQTPAFCYMQILLPIVCGLMFMAVILFAGGRAFWLSSIPVVLGAVFFIVKAASSDGILNTVLCVIVSLLAAILYCSAVFSRQGEKWPLMLVFGLPLLYQLLIRDRATILAQEGAMSLDEFIPELSVLCILLSLLLTVFAMKNGVPQELETVEGQVLVDEISPEDTMEKPAEEESEKKKLITKERGDNKAESEKEIPVSEEKQA